MNILEFLFEFFSNIGMIGSSKTKKSENFSNNRTVNIFIAISFFVGMLLLYVETNYIFGLKEFAKSILVVFIISVFVSLLLIFILNRLELVTSISLSKFFQILISFTVFFAAIFFGINFMLSDLFFDSR